MASFSKGEALLAPLVCSEAVVVFDGLLSTSMFETLDQVRALEVGGLAAGPPQSIAAVRGYAAADLWTLAEVGYHYLRSGGLRLAEVIFEGLAALQPEEAYHQLALGLVRDRLGMKNEACRAFEQAARLDPNEARADLNLAELALEAQDHARAERLLLRARRKAVSRAQVDLAAKATALLQFNVLKYPRAFAEAPEE